MDDLAGYLRGMDPQQRQMLMAEQLRVRQQNGQQQKLAAAMQGDPRMRMLAMAGMLSGNKGAEAATGFAYESDKQGRAPKQLGQTGFFNPADAEFVENPVYTGERRDAREAIRVNKELAAETTRENTRLRVEQQREAAAARADAARDAERGRNERAAESIALRQSIAAMAGGRARDVAYDRIDREDEAAYRRAEEDAGKEYAGALANRGDKALSSKEMGDLQSAVTRVRTLGDLAARLGDGEVGPRGALGGFGAAEEAKAYLARESPLARSLLGKKQEFADQWWADYRSEFENLERNKLFGSALTASETALWNKSNLSRGLPDEEIKRRIANRIGIANGVLARMAEGQAANKKNEIGRAHV